MLLGRSVRRPRERPLKPGPTVLPASRQPASQPTTTARTQTGVTTRERRRHASPLRLREPSLPQGRRELAGRRRAGRGSRGTSRLRKGRDRRGLVAFAPAQRARRRPASFLLKRVAGNCSGSPWRRCLLGGSAYRHPWAWPWRCNSPGSKASPCAGAPRSWPSSSVSPPRTGRRAGRAERRPPAGPRLGRSGPESRPLYRGLRCRQEGSGSGAAGAASARVAPGGGGGPGAAAAVPPCEVPFAGGFLSSAELLPHPPPRNGEGPRVGHDALDFGKRCSELGQVYLLTEPGRTAEDKRRKETGRGLPGLGTRLSVACFDTL